MKTKYKFKVGDWVKVDFNNFQEKGVIIHRFTNDGDPQYILKFLDSHSLKDFAVSFSMMVWPEDYLTKIDKTKKTDKVTI